MSYSTSGIDLSPSTMRERIFSTRDFSKGSMLWSSDSMLSIFSLNFFCSAAPSCVRNSTSRSMASLMAPRAAVHSSSSSSSTSVRVITSGRRSSVPNQSVGRAMPLASDMATIWS